MQTRHRWLLTALVALFLTPPGLRAQAVVYNNGTPDNRGGWNIDHGFTTANNFTLSTTTSLGTFNWFSLAGSDGLSTPTLITSQYFLEIMNDVGGLPGSTINSISVTGSVGTLTPFGCCSGIPSGTDPFVSYLFSTNLGGLTLGPGNYWIALSQYSSNYPSTNSGGYNYWATSQQFGNQQFLYPSSPGWDRTGSEGAFNITEAPPVTATPEPATISLVATGLFGLGGFARRRRQP